MIIMDTGDVVRVRLDLSYDGTAFAGWAEQPELRTIQGVLEAAIARVTRVERPRVTVAGRTDAGVHARGQVAHVDLPRAAWERMPGRIRRTPAQGLDSHLNGVLPADVVVRAVSEAPPGFDARYSAIERRYAYRLCDDRELWDPLRRIYVVWAEKPLDLDSLNAASDTLAGLRDFAPFCKPRPGATTIRHLTEFSWSRPREGVDAGLVVATVRGDAFCHNMVRGLVGAVLAVGSGRRDQDWLEAVASGKARSQAVTVAPPAGLTLEAVEYPADSELLRQAETARRRRSLN